METGPLILYSALSGLLAGLLAAGFAFLLKVLSAWVGLLLGYLPPEAPGEGGLLQVFTGPTSVLLVLFLPLGYALGGLLALGNREGEAPWPLFHPGRALSFREFLGQVLGGLFQLALYSPLGREGPMALLGRGAGSLLGRIFPKAGGEGLAFAGLAAGFASALHAPAAGALLATEVLYPGLRLEAMALAPALVGALSGFALYGAFFGYEPLLNLSGGRPSWSTLPASLLLGLVAAGLGSLWLFLAQAFQRASRGLSPPQRHGVLGLALALCLSLIPEAVGQGLGWVQVSLTPLMTTQPLLLLAHLLLVALAAGLGGYGGIITPALALGGLLGAFLSRLLPPLFPYPEATALVGMAALLAGLARAPFAALLLAGEWGGYTVLPLAIPAVFLSYALTPAPRPATPPLGEKAEAQAKPKASPSETPPQTEPPPSLPEGGASPETPRG